MCVFEGSDQKRRRKRKSQKWAGQPHGFLYVESEEQRGRRRTEEEGRENEKERESTTY
jgi:hypothetical protein